MDDRSLHLNRQLDQLERDIDRELMRRCDAVVQAASTMLPGRFDLVASVYCPESRGGSSWSGTSGPLPVWSGHREGRSP